MKSAKRARLVLAGVCVLFALQWTQAEPETLARWGFDEGQGETAKDAGATGLDLTLKNPEWVEGRKGKALYFDREDAYAFNRSKAGRALDLADKPFTLSVWLKPDEDIKRQSLYEILNFDSGDLGPGYRLYIYGGRVCFRSGDGKDKKSMNVVSSHASKNKLPRGEWFHVAVTRDEAGMARVYIDGELAGEQEGFKIYPFGKAQPFLCVGTHPFLKKLDSLGYKGAMDDLVFYGEALSQEEIVKEAKGIEL